ncbi:putative Diguanylate cyclase [Sterolibacterium denitrificans]|uniref:Diguanylate cyclase n=1 Tax=Sterolibacterium denitrificans TaxID=157592 RepID=A0A7Z7MVJ3_9PROT|nr:sensor domain-containing diguanylate cyclase [Sterolibacterium denitrificans]SMB25879.1 putative Diguanylate cyclase [Sterolibacterium denitrificans]
MIPTLRRALPVVIVLAYLLIGLLVLLSFRLNLPATPGAQVGTLLWTHLLAYFAIAGLTHLLLRQFAQGIPRSAQTPDRQQQTAVDTTEHLRAERNRRLAMAVFESTAEAIMITDGGNRIVMVNPAFSRITGYSPEEVVGQSPNILSSGRHDGKFYEDMWRSILQTGSWSGEIWNRRKDGSPYIEWLTITALRSSEEKPHLSDLEGCYVATFTDITLRKETEDQLRFKANHDMLTGLPNRSLFEDHLQLAISHAKRYHRSFALLYIDLDYFKNVNDTMGHAAGDALLGEAGKRMALCVRESDTLSRLGGDEFAALLSEINSIEEIEDIARRVVSTLDQPFQLEQGIARISGSVGIAIYPQHGTRADELKENADLALYTVKKTTRNAYLIYAPEMKEDKEIAG